MRRSTPLCFPCGSCNKEIDGSVPGKQNKATPVKKGGAPGILLKFFYGIAKGFLCTQKRKLAVEGTIENPDACLIHFPAGSNDMVGSLREEKLGKALLHFKREGASAEGGTSREVNDAGGRPKQVGGMEDLRAKVQNLFLPDFTSVGSDVKEFRGLFGERRESSFEGENANFGFFEDLP